MDNSFSEIKLFQVKPDKLDDFEEYAKDVMKLLIMPFDINSGYSV